MPPPAIWRNRERRTNAIVLAIFLWAPAWMVPAVIIGTPAALVAGAVMTGLPLATGAVWLLWIVVKQADPVQRILIALFFVFIIGVAAAVPNWAPYQDQY